MLIFLVQVTANLPVGTGSVYHMVANDKHRMPNSCRTLAEEHTSPLLVGTIREEIVLVS